MNNQLLVIIFVIILVVLAVFWFANQSGEVVTPGAQGEAPKSCMDDVIAAQDASLDKFCTAEYRELRCPSEGFFTYGAPNGCEISFLKERGWAPVE